MKITQIAYSKKLNKGKMKKLETLAELLGPVRSLVWQRYGSVAGAGVSSRTIRDLWMEDGTGDSFGVPVNYWKETLRDAKADIEANQAAAKVGIKPNVFRRVGDDKEEQKRLFTTLKYGDWGDDKWLSSQMRNRWVRGYNHTHNQIIVRSDTYKIKEGWIGLPGLDKGRRIWIPVETYRMPISEKGNGPTLRLILRGGQVEVHYAIDAPEGKPCGIATVGVDKGYTEVLVDSDGVVYGPDLGKLLTAESNIRKLKGQRRARLRSIANNTSNKAKAERIRANNLGRKKADRRKGVVEAQIKTLTYTGVHRLNDKAAVIAAEDLTKPFTGKNYGPNMNRKLSGWTKGITAKALKDVSERRRSTLVLVNAAYTSQTCQCCSSLGKRTGDKFYCPTTGMVYQADENSAISIKNRLTDPDISLYTPYLEVRRIILERTDSQRLRLPNQDTSSTTVDKQ